MHLSHNSDNYEALQFSEWVANNASQGAGFVTFFCHLTDEKALKGWKDETSSIENFQL